MSRKPRKRRAYCPGKTVVDGACSRCYRPVRTTVQGVAYKHFAKAPTDRSDPAHSKRILDIYGITGEEYEAILEAQGGVCYICQQPPRSKRLAVDHDHEKTGRESVRGLLCRRCNHRLLGSAHDGLTILQRAIEYLTNPPAKAVLT